MDAIAIIGTGCRFPRANDPESFWQLLRNGVDVINEVPSERWDANALYDPDPDLPGKMNTRWGGFLERVEQFEPSFFGISSREAEFMDPQQRLLLEVTWEAIENAGLVPKKIAGSQTGVFIGISNYDYHRLIFKDLSRLDAYSGRGTSPSITANRLSYVLDLRGPSVAIDTACSSSLVAVHLACQSLHSRESNLCLVGGVNLILSPEGTITLSKARMMASAGCCKTFDASADGYVRGEGCGVVVLKRLCDALRDKDNILALIRGSAVNQDGLSNGLTAPNGPAQQAVIRQALENGGVAPAQISYVEAHGTATPLGDPIEVKSLKAVLMEGRSLDQPCWLGSVKTNIGHLEAAAGIAGLIKVVLSLQHGEIPPHLHLNQLNPYISLEGTTFSIPTECQPWSIGTERRFAGVSSFGFGGTNSHVILEEAPISTRVADDMQRPLHLLTISAKSEKALRELAQKYEDFLASHPEASLTDICFTANTGRSHFSQRLAVVTESTVQLRQHLGAFASRGETSGLVSHKETSHKRPKIAFLFTGQGSQYVNMGRQLYETQPTFRACLERCDRLLHSYLPTPLLEVLYPPNGTSTLLDETVYTQPALFVLEYALAELWKSWGIEPAVVMGHSVGEYVAACVAGVFSLEDGLKLIAERALLMHALPQQGEMVVVFANEARVAAAIQPYSQEVSIATINSPENIVISGAQQAVEAVIAILETEGIETRRLKVSHAFHSPLMEQMLNAFEQKASQIPFQALRIPLISNFTGQMMLPGHVLDANYWRCHTRETVRFMAGVNTLFEQGYELFLELGPTPILSNLGKRCQPEKSATWLPSLVHGKDNWQALLESLSNLYMQGADINWIGFEQGYSRRLIALPTYPFQRQPYWIEDSLTARKMSGKKGTEFQIDATSKTKQLDTILSNLRSLVGELLRVAPSEVDIHTPFLEMGADSIVLIEAVRIIENTYGLKITIRQLFEELTNLDTLATYINQNLFLESTFVNSPQSDLEPKETASETALERIMRQQLEIVSQTMSQVVSQQLELLHKNGLSTKSLFSSSSKNGQSLPTAQTTTPVVHSPWPVAESSRKGRLNPEQQRHLEVLIANYTKQTQKSKQQAQTYHQVLSDSRAVAGFRPSTKEMLYPIIGERAQGAKFWDVDGNEYVDISMGFGVLLFGHAAPFITEALQQQIAQGIQIGPQSNLAGEVAQLICELTGMERVTFCNSGTEAVMTALRLARTTTGRTKIALFAGSYHGHSDGVLATALNGQSIAVPMAPGVSQHAVEDVLVLDYGELKSIEILQACAHELAAVLVEPVQSRRPNLQPKEFLQQLRQLTEAAGTALIFDEVLTGFRIHLGGAQAWFGIESDITTYGKIIGGGMPIGVVAGKATYMNGIDGGLWKYGDASYPQAEKTFFAGTFNKNHMGMAAAHAVLKHLLRQGPALQQQLNQRTSQLAITLNAYFEQEDVPIRIVHFGSLFRFTFSGNLDLLFYHLLSKGVYIWEGRNCFLSTAHTDQDIDYVIQAVKDSIEELREGGFLPKRSVKPQEGEKKQSSMPASASLETRRATDEEAKEPHKVPLTEAQKQLWILTKMGDDGSLAYKVSISLQLRGRFYLEAMRQAVQKIVNRHEALRTTINNQGDFQQLLPSVNVNISLIDFSGMDVRERESKVAEWFHKESRSQFDLSSEPLLRVRILKLEAQLHLLVLTTHHIVVDGWSLGIIIQELGALYSAECQGVDCQIEPPMQFREYIQWQEQQSQTEAMAVHESYWLEEFASSIPILNLPTDRLRPPIKTYRGSRQKMRLDASLCRDIKRFSREKGCTLFMTLLSVYTVLLHRLTGQDDIVVGIPAAGRSLKGSAGLVGYCAHLLPIRSCVFGDKTFSKHLTTLRDVLLEAYEHQDYPFARLIGKLKVDRDASLSPIVTTIFNLDRPVAVPQMFEVETDLFFEPINFTGFDLGLDVNEIDSELLVLNCDYNTDLFDAATIERLLGHFRTLLEESVANPQQSVLEIPLLTAAQRHQLLVEWNDTLATYPQGKFIHQLFEAQVERTPDAVAVVFEDQQLTYEELNARANQLAHYLQALGVGPEVLVGICVERSLEMVVGLLGILKAGGAYVPLDPAYPQERLALMLSDAQVSVLLTQEQLVAGLPEHRADVVSLDADWRAISQENQENPISGVSAKNLAYVIYTSGSTGKPKGVQISHSCVANLLNSIEQHLELTAQDILLAVTTISFDIAALELYLPLIVGAQVMLTSREQAVDKTQLLEELVKSGATLMQATPATWQLLLASGWKGSHQLKILCGGEALPQVLANQLLEKGSCLWNLYGPTEATIWSSAHNVGANHMVACTKDTSESIGRPIANTQLYILDPELQPVPLGVPGELHIGGAGLARGYRNRPELTLEKFIPNPFSNEPGARLYKTGDLARYLSDGNIEYLGRIDHQVKIRGFRIELGEVEAVLTQHPEVQETVVIAREDQPGNKRLVAYVVPYQEQLPTPSELHRFLKEKLPEYMVPSAFVLVATLSLTPNGKIDRRALPDPEGFRPQLTEDYVMPQTEAERLIAAIWQEVVQVEKVGIHDNFFELGGHSLLMVQIQNKLQETFGRELSVVELFKYPTVHTLVKYLSQEQSEYPSSGQSYDRAQSRSVRQSLRKQQRQLRKKHREELSFGSSRTHDDQPGL